MKQNKKVMKVASEVFCDTWELNREKIEQMEKDFGEKMKRITDHMFEPYSPYAEEPSPAYDFQNKYRALEELVEAYKDIFHIVSATIGWKDDD